MTVTILEEARTPTRITTLERTPSGDTYGKFRIKDVKLKYFTSEAAARAAYLETTQTTKRGRARK